jgi:hypothetical protein
MDRLPGAKVGTVDKFQGQQAAIVVYSMTTSVPEDAPRGMEFLYTLNRFNGKLVEHQTLLANRFQAALETSRSGERLNGQ